MAAAAAARKPGAEAQLLQEAAPMPTRPLDAPGRRTTTETFALGRNDGVISFSSGLGPADKKTRSGGPLARASPFDLSAPHEGKEQGEEPKGDSAAPKAPEDAVSGDSRPPSKVPTATEAKKTGGENGGAGVAGADRKPAPNQQYFLRPEAELNNLPPLDMGALAKLNRADVIALYDKLFVNMKKPGWEKPPTDDTKKLKAKIVEGYKELEARAARAASGTAEALPDSGSPAGPSVDGPSAGALMVPLAADAKGAASAAAAASDACGVTDMSDDDCDTFAEYDAAVAAAKAASAAAADARAMEAVKEAAAVTAEAADAAAAAAAAKAKAEAKKARAEADAAKKAAARATEEEKTLEDRKRIAALATLEKLRGGMPGSSSKKPRTDA